MGYFSNSTEGNFYEQEFCAKCWHYHDWAVLQAHMLYNYEECNNPNSILHLLIPRSEDGLSNLKCRMFVSSFL